MSKFNRAKSLFSTLFITTNSMVCKFRKPLKELANTEKKWGLERFTQFSIHWKKRGLLNPVGEMKGAEIGGALDEGTINSQLAVMLWLRLFTLFAPVSSHGNRAERFIDNGEELKNLAREDKKQYLEEINDELEYREKIFELRTKSRKYQESEVDKLWAMKNIAYPVSYVFPKARREEWYPDLYDVIEDMIRKGYKIRSINFQVAFLTFTLLGSTLKIKLSDFISLVSSRKG